jgi:hypothetical protein
MDNVVAIVIGFVLTTVAGGWWAAQLQQRSWEKQNDSRMREEENQRASAACRDLTSLLDRRLYRMQRLLWAATAYADGSASESELEERRTQYVDVLIDWNERLNMNLSLVGSYFGDEARAYLDGLYEEFKRVGQLIEAAVRAARAGVDPPEIASQVGVEFEGRGRGTLNDRVYQFGLILMGQLREGKVGRYAPNASTPWATN